MLHSWNIVEHIQKIPKGEPRFFFVSFTADMHRCVAVLFFETFARIARARGPKSLASASAAATRLSFFISLISFVRAWHSLLAFWPLSQATSTSHVDSSANPGISVVSGVVGNLKICMLVQTT